MSDFNNIEEDEIDLKELFRTISYRKWSIVFIALLVTLGAVVYSYYSPNVYQATSTLQIEADKKSSYTQDVLAEALSGGVGSNLDTEIEVIKSRYLVQKIVERLNLNKEYFGINKFYKKVYYYNNSPIKLDLLLGTNLTFTITPKTNNTFILETNIKLKDGNEIEYKKEHIYNKKIINKYFALIVKKDNNTTLDMRKYIVSIHEPQYFADNIRKNNLSVSNPSKNADILKITYNDNNAKRAKDFVSALTEEYLKQSLERKTKEATFTLNFINKLLKKIKQNLSQSSKQLETFKKKTNTVNVKESITQLSQQLAEYEKQKNILNMKLSGVRRVIEQIKKGNIATLTLAGVGIDNTSIEGLITELQQAMVARKGLLKKYTNTHPEVKKINARIQQLKNIISSSVKNILSNLNQQKIVLDKKLKQLEGRLKALPKQEQDYIGLERNFMFNDKFYTYLMEKKTETEIKKAATISNNRILDMPLLPEKPIKPKRKLIIAVGLILGLILGIMYAFLKEYLDNTLKNEEDITDSLDIEIPIAGVIPHYKNKTKDRTLVMLESPKSPAAEAFRNIRTNLQFMLNNEKGNVISVTSTIAGEGKTSISANLAATLHLLKKRVIIINLDLRKPTLHTLFNIVNSKGVSNYLSGTISKEEAIHKTEYEYIDIIPAGIEPPNPNELIASPKLEELIGVLRDEYDYIILDTPPIGLVADTKVIVQHSGLTIYVLRANVSKKDFLKLPKELYKSGIKLAIVLNDIKFMSKGYGYGSGYGYGYY